MLIIAENINNVDILQEHGFHYIRPMLTRTNPDHLVLRAWNIDEQLGVYRQLQITYTPHS